MITLSLINMMIIVIFIHIIKINVGVMMMMILQLLWHVVFVAKPQVSFTLLTVKITRIITGVIFDIMV